MDKPKLERCGACGDFQSDPRGYTEEEQNNAKLVHCGCEQDEPRYITRDMAIDAEDRSLEGEIY